MLMSCPLSMRGLTSNSAVTGLPFGPRLHGYSMGKVLCWAVPNEMVGRRNDVFTLVDFSPWSPLCLLALGDSGERESKEGREGALVHCMLNPSVARRTWERRWPRGLLKILSQFLGRKLIVALCTACFALH